MAFPYDRSNNPRAAITWGRDYNYFQKVSVNTAAFATDCDSLITFTTQGLMFLNEGTGVVEFSFNGTTVHGELDSTKASAGLSFDNRVVSKIWFRVKTGSSGPIVVSVTAWGIR